MCVRVGFRSITGESDPMRRGTRGGTISINGVEIREALVSNPDVSSVHQHDVPNPVLTVMEVSAHACSQVGQLACPSQEACASRWLPQAMEYAASLRLHTLSASDRAAFTERIAKLLDVWRLRNKVCSGCVPTPTTTLTRTASRGRGLVGCLEVNRSAWESRCLDCCHLHALLSWTRYSVLWPVCFPNLVVTMPCPTANNRAIKCRDTCAYEAHAEARESVVPDCHHDDSSAKSARLRMPR